MAAGDDGGAGGGPGAAGAGTDGDARASRGAWEL